MIFTKVHFHGLSLSYPVMFLSPAHTLVNIPSLPPPFSPCTGFLTFVSIRTQNQYSGLPQTLQLKKHESSGSTLSSSLEAWLHLSLCSAPTASSAMLSGHLQTSLKQLFSLYCLSIFSFTDKSRPSEQRYAVVSFI